MALIICEECGREISSRAKACPHCGCPVPEDNNIPASDIENKAVELKSENTATGNEDDLETKRNNIEVDSNDINDNELSVVEEKTQGKNFATLPKINNRILIVVPAVLLFFAIVLFLILSGKNPAQSKVEKILKEDGVIASYITNIQNVDENSTYENELLIADYQFRFDDSRNSDKSNHEYTGGRFRMFPNSKLVDINIELLEYYENETNKMINNLDLGELGDSFVVKPTHKYAIGNALLEINENINKQDADTYYECLNKKIGNKKYRQNNVPDSSTVEDYLKRSKNDLQNLIDENGKTILAEARNQVQTQINNTLDSFENDLSDELKAQLDSEFELANHSAYSDFVPALKERYELLLEKKAANDERLLAESKTVINNINRRISAVKNTLNTNEYDNLVKEIGTLKNNKYYKDYVSDWNNSLESIENEISIKKEKESFNVVPSYDELMRYSDTYKNEKIKISIYISKVESDGIIFDGTIWGKYQGQQVVVRDKRENKEPKILTGDTIVVYGNGGGLTKVKTYVQGTGLFGSNLGADVVSEVDVPVIEVQYCDFR